VTMIMGQKQSRRPYLEFHDLPIENTTSIGAPIWRLPRWRLRAVYLQGF